MGFPPQNGELLGSFFVPVAPKDKKDPFLRIARCLELEQPRELVPEVWAVGFCLSGAKILKC